MGPGLVGYDFRMKFYQKQHIGRWGTDVWGFQWSPFGIEIKLPVEKHLFKWDSKPPSSLSVWGVGFWGYGGHGGVRVDLNCWDRGIWGEKEKSD